MTEEGYVQQRQMLEEIRRRGAIEIQGMFLTRLARGDPDALAEIEAAHEDAIRINREIDRLAARTPEEVERDRKANRDKVEKARWRSTKTERTTAQLINDGRRSYRAEYAGMLRRMYE